MSLGHHVLAQAALAVVVLSTAASTEGPASVAPPSPAASPAALSSPPAFKGGCPGPESRQFDFWIGQWEVRGAAGTLAGTNRIAPILGGCTLHERWAGVRGMTGESFSSWDPADRKWKQTWVDDSGLRLELAGGLEQGRMVMTGALPDKDGRRVTQRLSWTRRADGRVRQHWETSADGASWTTVFDGLYAHPMKEGGLGADALDFWLGTWEVRFADGTRAGTDRVEKIPGGGVLEQWTDARGGEGRGFFYYVPGSRDWKQVWLGAQGEVKEKVARAEEEGVRFEGRALMGDGRIVADRTTLRPLEDGRIRQLIEISSDGGATWTTRFEAFFTRTPTPSR